MQQALAQMHALTRPAEPQALPPTQQRSGKASKASAAAASSTVSGVSSGEQRARKASLEGLYSLLAALQGIMSSDAYLKVRGACCLDCPFPDIHFARLAYFLHALLLGMLDRTCCA